MKKMNFKWLVVLCMAMGFVNVVTAQIYCSDACFYSEAGNSNVKYVVRFDYAEDRVWLKSVSHSKVRNNLAKSEDYYEEEVWTDRKDNVRMYEYDYQKSTSSREVYKYESDWRINNAPYCSYCMSSFGGYTVEGCGRHGSVKECHYVAFSKDTNSFIKWWEKKDDYSGEIKGRADYSRIPKEDLLPKAANYDFLND